MKRKMYMMVGTFAIFVATALGKVVTYPAPETECVKTIYTVTANGKNIDLYKSLSPRFEGGEYYFGYFDFDGEVNIEVKCARSFQKLEVLPRSINTTVKEKKRVTFTQNKPFTAIILDNERAMPLIIFGNPIEKNRPKKDDPNVVYFGAGVHVKDTVTLKSNQTLYLEGGAVVKSKIRAEGDNITVCGRGILSGELIQRFAQGVLANFTGNNITLKDVIFKDAASWTLVFTKCNGLKINGVKVCGSRMINDDAIDLCSTSNVEIKNVFTRTQDDSIAIKAMGDEVEAMDYYSNDISTAKTKVGNIPCENIVIEDCIFWTDIANIFRIGYECMAEAMRNIRVKNIDVPFYAVNCNPVDAYWAKAIIWLQATSDMPMHDIHFENITVRSNGTNQFMLLANPRPVNHGKRTAGRVYDCSLKNITVWGEKGDFSGLLYFKGFDANRDVKNISLENVNYFGEKIDANYKHFRDEKIHTSNITIK